MRFKVGTCPLRRLVAASVNFFMPDTVVPGGGNLRSAS